MLVVFGGLPGSGKTTIAQQVAHGCGATYLRIDIIEQAIRSAQVLSDSVGPAGYMVAYALAAANLDLGRIVIADSVNPLEITRQAWRSTAQAARCDVLEIEIACSDAAEHRRRVENRTIDIPDLTPPTWQAVQAREYEPWRDAQLRIDTATTAANEAASKILLEIERRRKPAR